MKRRLESARLLVYRAAWEIDRGGKAHAEAALAKWLVADAALESALDAVQLRGGEGFLSEAGLGGTVHDTLGGTIHSGTQDVCASIVSRWLGL
jgi:alkylation response protein AidB-like acyl-CoA dehydrogenase